MVLPLFMGLDGVWSAGLVSDALSLIVTIVFVIVYHKKYGYYGKEKIFEQRENNESGA